MFLPLYAWLMASRNARCCGIFFVNLRIFDFWLLTSLSDNHDAIVLCANLVAFLLTWANFESDESDVFGRSRTHRKKLYSFLHCCVSLRSVSDPENSHLSTTFIAFRGIPAALYSVLLSLLTYLCWSSGSISCWRDAYSVRLLNTLCFVKFIIWYFAFYSDSELSAFTWWYLDIVCHLNSDICILKWSHEWHTASRQNSLKHADKFYFSCSSCCRILCFKIDNLSEVIWLVGVFTYTHQKSYIFPQIKQSFVCSHQPLEYLATVFTFSNLENILLASGHNLLGEPQSFHCG